MGFLRSLAWSTQFLLLYSLFLSMVTNCLPSVKPTQCHEDESNALLQFKESFVISKSASYDPFSYPKAASWMPSTDCCSWKGIGCDELTGHVIAIDLSSSQLYGSMDANSSLFQLVHLQRLDLSDNDFNQSQIPFRIGELSQLNWLSISQCNFLGSIPSSFGNLNQLVYLDLGYNTFTVEIFPSCFANLTQLSHLSIAESNLSGEIPSWIMNLTNLSYLNVLGNNLHGEIPRSIFTLENLATLALSFNLLEGQVELDMFLKLKMLTFLELSYNQLSLFTRKSSSNVTLPPIQVLGLKSCNLSGEIPSWIMNLTGLSYLSLQDNNLRGEIPHSLFRLEYLATLSLSENLLEGQLELDMFLKLKMLTFLGLSNNKLSLLTGQGSSNATLPPLELLDLRSCNLTEFPIFLRDLDELGNLDMSYNDLKSLPSWLWRKRSLQTLYVSHSSLTGEISPLICNLKSLIVLDLSYNNLSSMIPSCLGTFSQSLQILMLQGNRLFGRIPQTYMIGSALKMIDFSDNNLQGQLPRALVNCRMLEFLDVSHNQINDSFPFWLCTLPELKVIALRYNKFYGDITSPWRCTFPKLHIIDLSHNEFSGNLPQEIIKKWKSMAASNISQLQYEDNTIHITGKTWFTSAFYSFTMSNKGVIMDYKELQQDFYFMIAIDISSNRISGDIPNVIGDLKGLVFLNLSNNMLAGSIPSSLGKLSNLEALDLSLNNLSGKIPQQLTELTFLAFFNVSFNNLSGPIPGNKQFATFQGTSFEGNQGLCGIQLLKKCEDHAKRSLPASDGDQDSNSGSFFEFDWRIILIGYGVGFIAGLALGSAFSLDIFRLLKRIV